jgi:hypothetical protein
VLKFQIDDLATVREADRTHYVKGEDGKFRLDVSDHPDAARVNEFRTNNIQLQKDAEAWKGVDLVAAKAALANAAKGDGDAVVALKLELATAKSTAAAAQAKADRSVLRDSLRQKALAAGVLPAALDIFLDKAEAVFEVKGDSVQARPNIFSKGKPGDALTPDEYVTNAITELPFLFGKSSGGGSSPHKSSGSGPSDGRQVLRDPSPKQLGEHSRAIARGEMRVEYSDSGNSKGQV